MLLFGQESASDYIYMNKKVLLGAKYVLAALLTALLVSCASLTAPDKAEDVHDVFAKQHDSKSTKPLVIPSSVSADLFSSDSSLLDTVESEERLNISANHVPLKPFLQSMVEDSPYSLVFHPGAQGMVSLDLKDVTIAEVVNVLNRMYPVDIQFNGKIVQVFPADVKTETIDINYLMLKRFGMTSTNISAGGLVQNNQNGGASGMGGSGGQMGGQMAGSMGGMGGAGGMMGMSSQGNGSNIQTSSESDYWQELEDTLKMIMKSTSEQDAKVVVSPQSGLVTVRGLPSDIQAVKNFIKRSEENLLRQVILEAKIVEVALDDDYQQGINWNNVVSESGDSSIAFNTSAGTFGNAVSATLGNVTSLSFSGVDFSGVVNLLQTQGNVQVLSAPRVTATNNQKAVIKVGEDEYFVTDVSNTNTVTGASTTSAPDIELEPFFSGIALDVTPQISAEGEVILHVHPSVTETAEQQKVVTLNEEQYILPLAQSNIRESDTVIKAKSGEIVVIGGLMQSYTSEGESRVPYLGAIPFLGELFKSTTKTEKKKELVILLKPTVVGTGTWREQLNRSAELLNKWYGN